MAETCPSESGGRRRKFEIACWVGAVLAFCMAYVFYRLGVGRLHGQYYLAVIATGWSMVAGLLCFALALERGAPGKWHWLCRCTGPLASLLIFVGLYGVAQLICWRLIAAREARFLRDGPHSAGTTYTFDRVLGYAPRANTTSGARLTVDGEVVFDYTYTTDSHRRRVVPSQAPEGADRALLLFGGSYIFGEGVNDEDTVANRLAESLPHTAFYNYGFSGYGPSQMLARLESYDVRAEVPQEKVAAVYVFIPNHVRRVIGAYSVISWTRHAPYYIVGKHQTVERLGSFQGERPGITGFYDFLNGDHVLKYFQLDVPLRLGDRHFKLTAAIVAAAAARFEAQFKSLDFTVIIYPECPMDDFSGADMAPWFEAAGLRVLDYSALFGTNSEPYFFLPHDGHPTARAHELVAEKLATEELFDIVE